MKPQESEKIAVGVREAGRMVSLGTTKIYELIKTQHLTRVRVGRRTLVTVDSLRRLIKEAQ